MSALERCLADVKAASAYIREEADSNRSWADGKRRAPYTDSPEYRARRMALAEECERWAEAIDALVRLFEGKPR